MPTFRIATWLIGLTFLCCSANAARYLVVLDNDTTAKSMGQHIQKWANGSTLFNNKVLDRAFALNKNNVKIDRQLASINMLVLEGDAKDIQKLNGNKMIQVIEEEVFFEAPQPIGGPKLDYAPKAVRQYTRTPWGIKEVKAPEAWAVNGRGQGVRVMVLDTGIDKNHPDIAPNFEAGRDFAGGSTTRPYDYFDTAGHGTHVAGTILGAGAGVLGVAPKARLLAGRVCTGGCSSVAIISGVDWAVSEKVDVVNMSLGGPFPSRGSQAAYTRAENSGVLIVAASGNRGSEYIDYPAAFATTMAVGALNPDLTRASFSQYGDKLDIVAPGVQVESAVPEGTGRIADVEIDGVTVNSGMLIGSAAELVTGEFKYIGLAKPEDVENINLRGYIALIKRGEITFEEKVKAAVSKGAAGVVVFNNEAGIINGSLTQDGTQVVDVPGATIEQTVGESIVAKLESGQRVRGQVGIVASDYAEMQGTSMASPHVAGVAALVRAANSQLSPAEVRDTLKRTATPLANALETASGLVNADAAVRDALGRGFIID